MGNEQAGAAVASQEGLEALEGHQRGSAEELLDAGAHEPIDAMRHSAAHVMAEAVLELFPRPVAVDLGGDGPAFLLALVVQHGHRDLRGEPDQEQE